jgi:hypothetical protein
LMVAGMLTVTGWGDRPARPADPELALVVETPGQHPALGGQRHSVTAAAAHPGQLHAGPETCHAGNQADSAHRSGAQLPVVVEAPRTPAPCQTARPPGHAPPRLRLPCSPGPPAPRLPLPRPSGPPAHAADQCSAAAEHLSGGRRPRCLRRRRDDRLRRPRRRRSRRHDARRGGRRLTGRRNVGRQSLGCRSLGRQSLGRQNPRRHRLARCPSRHGANGGTAGRTPAGT